MSEQAFQPPYPDGLNADNIRPVGRWQRHASPLSLAVFGVIVLLALLGILGHERTWVAQAGGTRLEIHAPEVIRNGEFLEVRIRVATDEPLGEVVIGVEDRLWEDITVNTMIPAPSEEENADGETRFTFTELGAGSELLFKVDAQVNPDILGGNGGRVTVYDGEDEVVATEISMMVLP
jgi:hypothetical protein